MNASGGGSWRVHLLGIGVSCALVACGGGASRPDAGVETPDAGVDLSQCGDGTRQDPEGCDDGNTVSNDGCSARCAVEAGWTCPAAGGACRAAGCGDLIVAGSEECEDGNATDGDGCSAQCRLEAGYKCEAVGQPCTRTVCGDGIVEGTEQCDDGNHDQGDGCSALCTREPRCVNGVCESRCGDGVLLPNDTTEECDDGNTRANDGCSPNCHIEPGFTCKLVEDAPPDTLVIPTVYRDLRGYDLPAQGALPRGNIDFEDKNGAETGIVASLLGDDNKPVYAKGDGTGSTTTHGKDAFDQWYRDVEDVNKTVVSTLVLVRNPSTGAYEFNNSTFFPLDHLGWTATGDEPMRQVTEGSTKVAHNFSFTSEARYWFEYKGTEVLDFLGDDDVWVFVNGRLALDLGGVHGALRGTLDLKNVAANLGLQPGGIYEVVVFQAERHTSASSYQLTLTNFVTRRTECVATCGNGTVDPGEECDEGANNGSGTCTRACVRGPRCGDGVVQAEEGEQCDDGNTVDGDGCSAVCRAEIK